MTTAYHAVVIALRPKCPMSAYSASTPVNASTTAPSSTDAWAGCEITRSKPSRGSRARSTIGVSITRQRPRAPKTKNQSSITGPKMPPMNFVPRYWNRKSPNRITQERGTTRCSTSGQTSLMPSTAPRTVIAGVITASPQSMAAPIRTTSVPMLRPLRTPRSKWPSASRAKTPPSPRLSARRTKIVYFTLTTTISDQTMRERTPKTATECSEGGSEARHSRMV